MFSNKTRSRRMWAMALASFLICALLSAIIPVFADEPIGDNEFTVDAVETEDVAQIEVSADNIAAPYLSGEAVFDPDADDAAEVANAFLAAVGEYDENAKYAENHKTIANWYVDNYDNLLKKDQLLDENLDKALAIRKQDVKLFNTWIALLPPIVAIVLALITKEVYSSLFAGILLGGMIATNFDFLGTVDAITKDGLIAATSGTAGIFIFLVILGIIVALVNKAGGAAAFGRWAEKNIKSRVGAMFATFVLGVLIFIDDYFNCLTVGAVMKPVTDRQKISRAKLAYLIDATAAPICMIAPISSWAAAVSDFAPSGEGLSLFIKAIPYNFYSLLTFAFVIGIVVMKFDFGPMKLHEYNAIANGDLYTTGDRAEAAEEAVNNPKAKVIDLLLPVIVLIAVSVFALVYIGGIFDGKTFTEAFGDTTASDALPWAGLIALVVTIIYYILRRLVSFKGAMECIPKGFIAMVPAILILTFATSLKNITDLLGADVFVGTLMNGAASGLNAFLPAIIFLVACGLSFSTGTSWGTFGILIPIVLAVFPETTELQIIGMSACLAGAVCGDHCSPISDTTIMSSAGAECNHVNHVSTQLPYAITVALISFVCYILAGFIQNWLIVLPIGIVLTFATLFCIKKITAKK